MSTPGVGLDPTRWPLAPGNAPEDVEAALRAEEQKWPEPTAAQRSRISSVFRRIDRKAIA
ncbi:hypothetical protein SEA_MALACHAI_43 [Gordonia phage Malachai]|nr:hypothetical protein SEA_BEGONIA_43 [Gordonia phage Begonia]UVF60474.1 hypothetical protein SEA_MALACHAI_43 [Gordonia phage Malachai]